MIWHKTLKLYFEYLNLEGRIDELWFRLAGLYRRGFLNAFDIGITERTIQHPRLPGPYDRTIREMAKVRKTIHTKDRTFRIRGDNDKH
jgi:hypothetical protein